MKIGLFFGTYNPIHVGHMVIANYMVEFTNLDKIWIIVTPHNPFKEKKSMLDDVHRLQLVKVAIDDDNRFKASDIEFKLPQPNYTIHTLTYLREQNPDDSFVLIMGADNLAHFHKWKNHEEILNNHEIFVYPRLEGEVPEELINHEKITLYDAPIMKVSSSFIRNSIAKKRDVRHYMPKDVWEYVDEMNFYK